MSRKNDNIDKAEKMFRDGMQLVKIAEEMGVSPGTVRSWKSRYGWGATTDGKAGNATLRKKSATLQSEKGRKSAGDTQSESTLDLEEINAILDNSPITEKQRLFCIYYIRCFNATKAYKKSHPDCSLETAAVEGHRLLRNPRVEPYIKALKQNRLNRELLSTSDIVQKYIDIAFADISDYVKIQGNSIRFNNTDDFDGTIVKKISRGKVDSIELMDRMQALKWLADHMDLCTEQQKAELELMRMRLKEQSGSETGENSKAYNNMQSILNQIAGVTDEEIAE